MINNVPDLELELESSISSRSKRGEKPSEKKIATKMMTSTRDTSHDAEVASKNFVDSIKGKLEKVSNTHITLNGSVQTLKSDSGNEYVFHGALVKNKDIEHIVEISEYNERKHTNINLIDTSDIDVGIGKDKKNSNQIYCYLNNNKLHVFDGQRRVISCIKNGADLNILFIRVDPEKNTDFKIFVCQLSKKLNKNKPTGYLSKIRSLKRELARLGYDHNNLIKSDMFELYDIHFKESYTSAETLRLAKDMIDKFDESFVLFFGNEDSISINVLKNIRAILKKATKVHYDNEDSKFYKVNLYSEEGTRALVEELYANDSADLNYIEFLQKEKKVASPLDIENLGDRNNAVRTFLTMTLLPKGDIVSKQTREIVGDVAYITSSDIDKSYTITIKDPSSVPNTVLEKYIREYLNQQ